MFSTWVTRWLGLHYTNPLVTHFRMCTEIALKSNTFYHDHQCSSSRLRKNSYIRMYYLEEPDYLSLRDHIWVSYKNMSVQHEKL